MSAPSENMRDGRRPRPAQSRCGCGTCRILSAAPFSCGLAATVQFDGYVHNILMQATTFAIAVFGLSVVLGLCGQINLAQAAFFGLGAYAVGLGTSDYHVSYWLCLAGGCVIALLGRRLSRHVDAAARRALPGDGDDLVPADRHARHDQLDLAHAWPRRRVAHRPARSVSVLAILSGLLRRDAGDRRLRGLASRRYPAWPRDARGARQ